MSRGRLFPTALLLAFSGLILLYFWEPLTRSVIFIERDLPVFFFPPLKVWTEAIKAGEWPLWNPYSFGGQPLFASLQTAVLYPLNILLLFLPLEFAFNLTIALHFLLAGWFIFLLCRRLGGSPGAGMLAALSFTLGGFLLSVHNVLSTLQSVVWAPLIFYFLLTSFQRKSKGYVLLTTLTILVQFLGGGIEVFLLTQAMTLFLGMLPGSLLPEKPAAPLLWRLKALVVVYLVFAGLGAVQILPFMEMVRLSIRHSGFPYEEATRWSLGWENLIYIFLPDFFWRGAKYYYIDQNWLKSIYLGIIPLVLGLFFFLGRNRRRIWIALFLIIPLLMALGKNTPFYRLPFALIPGFDKIHYPVKFFFMTNLFLCLLTGLGWDALVERLQQDPRHKLRILKRLSLILSLVSVGLLLGLSLFKDFFLAHFMAIAYDRPGELDIHNLSRLFFFSLVIFLLFSFVADGKLSRRWGLAGILLVLTADLFLGNWGQYKYADRQALYTPGPILTRALDDPSVFRVYTDPQVMKSLTYGAKNEKLIQLFYQERFNLDSTLLHRIYNASGFPVLVYRPYQDLLSVLESSPNPQATDLLRLMNVKYVLWHEEIKDPSFKLVEKGEPHLMVLEEKKPRPLQPPPYRPMVPLLYENLRVLPRAYLAPGFRVVGNESEMRDLLVRKGVEPAQTILLQEAPRFPASRAIPETEKDALRFLKRDLNHLDLEVSCRGPRILFLSETFYPGWKVWVDGREEKIYRAFHAFRAVALGPGSHRVVFSYQPFSFLLGLLISSATVIGIIGVLIWIRIKHRRR
jgi:Bacterial membrane protein YfhO